MAKRNREVLAVLTDPETKRTYRVVRVAKDDCIVEIATGTFDRLTLVENWEAVDDDALASRVYMLSLIAACRKFRTFCEPGDRKIRAVITRPVRGHGHTFPFHKGDEVDGTAGGKGHLFARLGNRATVTVPPGHWREIPVAARARIG